MNRAMMWKELREQRPVLLTGAGVAVVMPFLLLAYLSTQPRTPPANVFEWLPQTLAAVWPLLAVAAGAITVATEAEEGTIRFLLSRPVSRVRVWCVKVCAGLFTLAATGIIMLLVVDIARRVAVPALVARGAAVNGESWTLLTPLSLLGACLLLFACGVLCSTLVDRPLTAAAAGVAVGLLVLSIVLMLWAVLDLAPHLEPQWLALEMIVVAGIMLLVSLMVFSWPDLFAGRAATGAGKIGRALVGGAAVLLLVAALLPVAFAAATPRSNEVTVTPGSVSFNGSAVVMSASTGGGTTQNWLLRPDGSGIRQLTGRHTLAPSWSSLGGNTVAYYSRRGVVGSAREALDLHVTDLSGTYSHLVLAGMPGVQQLFFKGGSARKVAFLNGAELTVASLRGGGHETFDVSGTLLEDAVPLGFNLGNEDEIVFLSGDVDAVAGVMLSEGTLLVYQMETGGIRSIGELPAGSSLPALSRSRSAGAPHLRPVSHGWSVLPVIAVDASEEGSTSARIVRINPITGDAQVAYEIDVAWSGSEGLREFRRCDVVELAPQRRWRAENGRTYREAQSLFGDCSAAARPESLAGAIRLVGVETGNARTWALPVGWTGSIRRIHLDRAQDTVLLEITGATPADSYAMTINVETGARTYAAGWSPLGWTTLDYFLLQSTAADEVSFAVADARSGELLELFPNNDFAEVLRQRMLEPARALSSRPLRPLASRAVEKPGLAR